MDKGVHVRMLVRIERIADVASHRRGLEGDGVLRRAAVESFHGRIPFAHHHDIPFGVALMSTPPAASMAVPSKSTTLRVPVSQSVGTLIEYLAPGLVSTGSGPTGTC